jgi:hypothetical protein
MKKRTFSYDTCIDEGFLGWIFRILLFELPMPIYA